MAGTRPSGGGVSSFCLPFVLCFYTLTTAAQRRTSLREECVLTKVHLQLECRGHCESRHVSRRSSVVKGEIYRALCGCTRDFGGKLFSQSHWKGRGRGVCETFIQILAKVQQNLPRMPNTSLNVASLQTHRRQQQPDSLFPLPPLSGSHRDSHVFIFFDLRSMFQNADSRLISFSPELRWSAAGNIILQKNFCSFSAEFCQIMQSVKDGLRPA